jgi:undecaprenyl-diphosphatase
VSRRFKFQGFALLAVLAILLLVDTDHPLARFLEPAPAWLLSIFRFVTWFGQGGVVLVPSGIVAIGALLLKYRRPDLSGRLNRVIAQASLLFAAVALAGLANDVLKVLFGRARPRLWLHGDTNGFYFLHFGSDYASFPSGHTATSFAAAVTLGVLFPRWRIGFAAFALTIAVSRIVLDAHYLSDVVAGAGVGTISALIALDWFRGRYPRHLPPLV